MTFTVWWYRLTMAAVYALAILLCATTKLNRAPVITIPLAGYSAILIVLHMRGASVELSDHDLVIHGLRTRRIAWCRIRAVRVSRGTSVFLVPWRVPCFELDDGSTVLADEVRSLAERSIVDEVVSEVRRRIDPH